MKTMSFLTAISILLTAVCLELSGLTGCTPSPS